MGMSVPFALGEVPEDGCADGWSSQCSGEESQEGGKLLYCDRDVGPDGISI